MDTASTDPGATDGLIDPDTTGSGALDRGATNPEWRTVKLSPSYRHAAWPPRPPKAFDPILAAVAAEFQTSPEQLKAPHRGRAVVMARFAAVALILEFCPELSLPAIGWLLGGRDHTTIIHSRRRAGELLLPDKHSAPWRAKYHAARNRVLAAL